MRTDLAVEVFENNKNQKGVKFSENIFGSVKIEKIEITSSTAATKLGKPIGKYVTVNFNSLDLPESQEEFLLALKKELKSLLQSPKKILIAGLGNREITPDALGPKVAEKILATRHIKSKSKELLGVESINEVSVISPGVLGQTGIETAEQIESAVKKIKPDAVIVIDALASLDHNRLLKSVQLTNAGIFPGSGVGNCRKEISERTLGVKTVALGVPTVADLSNYLNQDLPLMVTPRDIDRLISTSAKCISLALNSALNGNLPQQLFLSL